MVRSMSWFESFDLVQCPGCPIPGLVPSQEMTNHIALLHQGDGFRCAVCKVGVGLAVRGGSIFYNSFLKS